MASFAQRTGAWQLRRRRREVAVVAAVAVVVVRAGGRRDVAAVVVGHRRMSFALVSRRWRGWSSPFEVPTTPTIYFKKANGFHVQYQGLRETKSMLEFIRKQRA